MAVNKGLAAARGGPFALAATAYRLTPAFAELPQEPAYLETIGALPAGAAVRASRLLAWPPGARVNETLLWRVELLDTARGGALVSRSEYFLSSLDTDASSGWPSMAALRDARYAAAPVVLSVAAAGVASGAGAVRVSVSVALAAGAARAALAVRCALHDPAAAVVAATGFTDDRALPQLPSAGYFSLLPGEARVVTIDAAAAAGGGLYVRVDAWNALAVDVPVTVAPLRRGRE